MRGEDAVHGVLRPRKNRKILMLSETKKAYRESA